MRSAYLLLDLGAILPLFIASLYKWRGVGVDYQKYAKALAFVSVPFLIWDIFATHWQHWGFNPEYTTGLKIANLPIEEVLFFVAIPFVCVYAWEWVGKQKEKKVQYKWQHFALSAFVLLGVLVFFYGGGYSNIIAPLFFAIVIFLFVKKYFESTYFWTYQLVMFGLFLAFNMILTAMPIVTYGEDSIIGFRIGSIPIEDFLYNFVLINSCMLVYKK